MLFQLDNTPHFVVMTVILLALMVALVRRLQAERRVLILGSLGLLAAIGGHYLALWLDSSGETAMAAELHAFSVWVVGLAILGLVATVFFRMLLPALAVSTPRILRDVISAAGQIAWTLIWLQNRGLNVAGIIATSAVITAVVGLSMQDTLGNIVSGLALQIDDSLHVGDWIKLDDLYGQVIETGWRYVAIETHNWETVYIPNTVLVKNRFMVCGRKIDKPVQWRRWVYFNVDFRYQPTTVIDTVQTALRSAHIAKAATDPAPSVVQMPLTDSYARYGVRYWLTDLLATDSTDSEVLSHLVYALQRVGIPLSIPAAAVFITEDTEARRSTKASHDVQGRMDALRGIDLFKILSDDELMRLAQQCRPAPFGPGDVITRQGAVAHWLYIMTEGTVDVFVDREDATGIKVAELGKGTCFGEWGLMTGEPRDASVIARTRVDCFKLGKEGFTELIQTRPELARQFTDILTQRRMNREHALEEFDASSHDERQHRTRSFIFTKVCNMFGIEV